MNKIYNSINDWIRERIKENKSRWDINTLSNEIIIFYQNKVYRTIKL